MKSKFKSFTLALILLSLFGNHSVSANWLYSHGNNGNVENQTATNFSRKGHGLEVYPQWADSTWTHFSVPTNGDQTIGAQYIHLEFTVDHAVDSRINRVDIYNGNVLVKSFANLNLNTPGFQIKTLNLGRIKSFNRGMGVSVEITAGPDSGIDQFTFHSVGANFVVKP